MIAKYLIFLALIGPFAYAFEEDIDYSFKKGLEHYIETGEESEELKQALVKYQFPHFFRNEHQKGLIQSAVCTACNTGMGVVLAARRNGLPANFIANTLIRLCVWFNIEPEFICKGAIETNVKTFAYIIDNSASLTSRRICSMILQDVGCTDPDRVDWTIEISEKPKIEEIEKTPSTKPIKILHLTDLHYDPDYGVGSNGACSAPLCCQRGTEPEARADAAGYWGDFRYCDTPWHALVDILDHVVSQHRDIDYIYFTGDIINHKVWATNIDGNTKDVTDVLGKFKQQFGDIPVFNILGNHEPHPVNLFSDDQVNDPEVSTKWVYELAASQWTKWLPEQAKKTILKGGYYTHLVKPGFRIIGLNSNVCYVFNWWLFYKDEDPFGQLKWLVATLEEAEKNKELVHILSHVPTGSSNCLINWSREYAKIIDRFSHVIMAQFTGHTHHDETNLYFSISSPKKAINVAFNGGSLTTYHHLNPNYKIFTIDEHTYEVLDFESWSFSISDANRNPQFLPNWQKLYSFKEAYGLKDLSPPSIAELVQRMTEKESLTQDYYRYKNRDGDKFTETGCDSDCEIANICYMVTSVYGDHQHCEFLTEMYKSNRGGSGNGNVTVESNFKN